MNYILFFPDELRAESLSCYGNDKIKTPNYDKLAQEGVVFEQCHVQNTVCTPSRCSLFTGQYVHVNGHRTLWNLLKPHEKNMMKYFKDSGYEVRVYGKNDVLTKESANLSTDVFESKHGASYKSKPVKKHGESGFFDFLYESEKIEPTETHDHSNLEAGLDFIKNRKKGDKPFVLFLPLSLPHCPYTIPEPYYSMYDENDVPQLRGKGENKPKYHELIRKYRDLSDTDFKKIHSVYMGMISYNDMLLGKLLDTVKEANIEDETWIISSSDHGDYAGDYNLVEKWPNGCEDILTRVPLLVKAPFAKQGHRVKEQVELFDIMASVLEDADIKIEHTHFAKSFIPQLKGEKGDENRAVFCEGGYNINEPHCNEGYEKAGTSFMHSKDSIYYPKGLQQKECPESVCRATMIRTNQHKLVLRAYGDNELYDLVQDEKELVNLYNDSNYSDVKSQLKERLLQWYLETSDVVPFEEDPRGL